MTNKEAIELLKKMPIVHAGYKEVIDIAIEALNCSEMPNNSDCISRQAAIDSMCELMRHWFGCDSKDEIREIKRELGKLPPAQPPYNPDEWCHDCKEYDLERHCCPRWNRVIRKTVDELRAEQAERREE